MGTTRSQEHGPVHERPCVRWQLFFSLLGEQHREEINLKSDEKRGTECEENAG